MIEKTLSEQIIDNMIDKLKESEHFNEELLAVLQTTDLTNKEKVKEVISSTQNSGNEDS